MQVNDYLRVLARRWWLIALMMLLGLGAALLVTSVMTPTYRASTQLLVSVEIPTAGAAQLSSGSEFVSQRVTSYPDIAFSRQVTLPVIDELGLDVSSRELTESLTADVPFDTALINLTYDDTDPRRAAAVADAVAVQLAEVIEEIERPKGGSTPVGVTITRQAEIPTTASSPRPALNLAIGAVGGLGVGVLVALLLNWVAGHRPRG